MGVIPHINPNREGRVSNPPLLKRPNQRGDIHEARSKSHRRRRSSAGTHGHVEKLHAPGLRPPRPQHHRPHGQDYPHLRPLRDLPRGQGYRLRRVHLQSHGRALRRRIQVLVVHARTAEGHGQRGHRRCHRLPHQLPAPRLQRLGQGPRASRSPRHRLQRLGRRLLQRLGRTRYGHRPRHLRRRKSRRS